MERKIIITGKPGEIDKIIRENRRRENTGLISIEEFSSKEVIASDEEYIPGNTGGKEKENQETPDAKSAENGDSKKFETISDTKSKLGRKKKVE